MFATARRKILVYARRLAPWGAVRRFARHQDGVAAVEFAFIAVPFLALLFAILETALVFFASQTLEVAVADSARLIMTGQAQTGVSAQTGQVGYTQQDFKNALCANLVGGLFDCTNGIYVNVQTYSSFGTASTAAPVTNGQLVTNNMAYQPGGPGNIVVVQVYYQWPIYVSLLGLSLSNLNNNYRLLVATAVFRNEPYQ
jgi:Flp pilus assembly protein TadG